MGRPGLGALGFGVVFSYIHLSGTRIERDGQRAGDWSSNGCILCSVRGTTEGFREGFRSHQLQTGWWCWITVAFPREVIGEALKTNSTLTSIILDIRDEGGQARWASARSVLLEHAEAVVLSRVR